MRFVPTVQARRYRRFRGAVMRLQAHWWRRAARAAFLAARASAVRLQAQGRAWNAQVRAVLASDRGEGGYTPRRARLFCVPRVSILR